MMMVVVMMIIIKVPSSFVLLTDNYMHKNGGLGVNWTWRLFFKTFVWFMLVLHLYWTSDCYLPELAVLLWFSYFSCQKH